MSDTSRGLPAIRIGEKYLSAFDPDTALRVCEEIAQGKLLKEVLDVPGAPTRSTWYRWMMLYPELKLAYDEARKLSAQALEEDMLTVAENLRMDLDGKTPQRLDQIKTYLSQARWSAARRNPGLYGEKSVVSTVVPIQINTNLGMGEGGVVQGGGSVYNVRATITTPDPSDPEEVEEEVVPALPQRKLGAPKQRPKPRHKSPAATARTLRNYQRREENKKRRQGK